MRDLGGSYLSQQGRTPDLIGSHGILQEGCLGESYLSEHGNSLELIGGHGMLQEGAWEVIIYAPTQPTLIYWRARDSAGCGAR